MHFPVPQFIEREPKIIGPLTFRQSLFIGIPFGICVILYLWIAKQNFTLFLIASILIMGTGLSLAFLKIKGRDLPFIITYSLKFYFLQPKKFFWQKKEKPVVSFEIRFEKEIPKKEERKPSLTLSDKISKLKTGKGIF